MTPETRFKIKVMTKLKEIPNSWWVKYTAKSIRGIPDIIGCVNGTFIAIELKKSVTEAKKKGRNVLQNYNLEKINMIGGQGYVMFPENFEEILAEITFVSMNTPLLKVPGPSVLS